MYYENQIKLQIYLTPVSIQTQNKFVMSVNQRVNFGFRRLHENQMQEIVSTILTTS